MKKMICLSFLVMVSCGCSTGGSNLTSTHPVTDKKVEKIAPAKKATAEKTAAIDDSSFIATSSKVAFLIKYKLRKNPSSKAAIVKSLERGEEAQVIAQQNEWFQVELASGGVGWCHGSAITLANKR